MRSPRCIPCRCFRRWPRGRRRPNSRNTERRLAIAPPSPASPIVRARRSPAHLQVHRSQMVERLLKVLLLGERQVPPGSLLEDAEQVDLALGPARKHATLAFGRKRELSQKPQSHLDVRLDQLEEGGLGNLHVLELIEV